MKTHHYLLLVILLLTSGCLHLQEDKNMDVLFQVSTINALMGGLYDGEITYGELKKHGDFGIGTFNGLDGEMIALGGRFYQIGDDGIANWFSDSLKTPFAAVTFFEADKSVQLKETVDYAQLKQYLDELLPSRNIFYAIKIEGTFNYVKTRSVPRQAKPYPPIAEVIKNQPTVEFQLVEGTMVGFYCPAYVSGVNIPGYHFHFINENEISGGHLLKCQIKDAKIEIDYTADFFMALPETKEFYQADLTKDKPAQVDAMEK